MKINIHPFRLQLRQPFRIAHGTYHYRDCFIVEIQDGEVSGYGEATAITYYQKNIDEMLQLAHQVADAWMQLTDVNPASYFTILDYLCEKESFVRCAFDTAFNDLLARKQKLPLNTYLACTGNKLPISSYTISGNTKEQLLESIEAMPWPLYKIKITEASDIDLVEQLVQSVKAQFAIDANGSLSIDELSEVIQFCEKHNIVYLEQPVNPGLDQTLPKKNLHPIVPIIADESVQSIDDVKRIAPYYHGINVKLMKCGGISPAIQMLKTARVLELKTMIGCMTETSIGISAAAHLAPACDYADLDGALLIQNNPAQGVEIIAGIIHLCKGDGTGARLN